MDVLRGDDDVEKTELFGWCLSVGIKPGQEVLQFVSTSARAILGLCSEF